MTGVQGFRIAGTVAPAPPVIHDAALVLRRNADGTGEFAVLNIRRAFDPFAIDFGDIPPRIKTSRLLEWRFVLAPVSPVLIPVRSAVSFLHVHVDTNVFPFIVGVIISHNVTVVFPRPAGWTLSRPCKAMRDDVTQWQATTRRMRSNYLTLAVRILSPLHRLRTVSVSWIPNELEQTDHCPSRIRLHTSLPRPDLNLYADKQTRDREVSRVDQNHHQKIHRSHYKR